jgi:hypothetical protein
MVTFNKFVSIHRVKDAVSEQLVRKEDPKNRKIVDSYLGHLGPVVLKQKGVGAVIHDNTRHTCISIGVESTQLQLDISFHPSFHPREQLDINLIVMI